MAGPASSPRSQAGRSAAWASSVRPAKPAVGTARRRFLWDRALRAAPRRSRSHGSARATCSAPAACAALSRRSELPTVAMRAGWRSLRTRSPVADRRRRARSRASAGPARKGPTARPGNACSTTSSRSRQKRSSSSVSATPEDVRSRRARARDVVVVSSASSCERSEHLADTRQQQACPARCDVGRRARSLARSPTTVCRNETAFEGAISVVWPGAL